MGTKKKDEEIGQAGNYAAPVDTVGMDPEMKATLGLGKEGREKRPRPTAPPAPPKRDPAPGNPAVVGTPGNRPLATSKNLGAIQDEIAWTKSVNAGNRAFNRRNRNR